MDEFLHDVRRLCANSFVFMRSTSNDLLKKFLRKLEAKEVKNVLTPSRPLVPKWQQCLAVRIWGTERERERERERELSVARIILVFT